MCGKRIFLKLNVRGKGKEGKKNNKKRNYNYYFFIFFNIYLISMYY